MLASIADQIMAALVAAATMVGIAAKERAATPTAKQAPPARSPTPSRCPNHHQQHSATAAIVAKVQADSVRRNREASRYPGQVQGAAGVALIAFVAAVVAGVAVAAEGQQTEVWPESVTQSLSQEEHQDLACEFIFLLYTLVLHFHLSHHHLAKLLRLLL